MTTRRVLFVDDEPNVLAGLQRMLRPMRHEWEMLFVGGAGAAIAALQERPFDVIVSDIRMPCTDGAALLDEVSRLQPGIVRIVLSGQANQEDILRVAGPAHQYLSKPCDADTLRAKVSQAFLLRELLANPALKGLVARLRSLPSVPDVYTALMNELRSPNASLNRIAEVVERDTGMTAKILQLANSAFFGVRSEVSSAGHAVQLLGLDLVRTLMLSTQLFSQADERAMRRYNVPAIWSHSLKVARLVRVIARLEGLSSDCASHAVTAAILQDAGRVVLAICLPEEYAAIVDTAAHDRRPLTEVELEQLGCTHAEVGAYLLGLWGLPDQVTLAVAWHHQPSRSGVATVGPLALIHAADAIVHGAVGEGEGYVPSPLDHAFLAALPFKTSYERWESAVTESAS